MFNLVLVSVSVKEVAMATNFRREISRNLRHAFLGLAFHKGWQYGKADGRINGAEVMYTSYKNMVNFGPLTPEFTMMVWQPFMHQMCEIGETHSILGTRIRQWMAGTTEWICTKFTWKTYLVLCSDELECQGQNQDHQGQKTCCALTTPPHDGRNGMASLQVTSRKQQARWFDHCKGVSLPRCMCWAWRATAGFCTHFYLFYCLQLTDIIVTAWSW